jgi:hypothetical protein
VGLEPATALGDTPNVAARLEAFAEPDTLVISDALLRLVPGLFVTEDRGTPALKGISAPIRAYRVLQPSGVASRLDRAPRLTPFVGREQELGLLLDRSEQAQERRGQAVWIAGEAGIGKSRLVHQLRERLRGTPHSGLECRCSPYTQNSALHPLIELVERGLRFEEELSPAEKLERLEGGLALVGLEASEAVPLLASLLSLRLPERYAPLEMSPELQRQRTLETLLSWIFALGEKQALLLVVEDLHWADPSTLEWLGLLIEQCATAGVLVLLTFRPDFELPWPARGHLLPIALSRLGRRQAKELVAAAAGEGLPEPVVDRLAARSDGIPLFVEELTKGVVESRRDLAGSLSELAIPETLQDSLMARLDRLGEAKQVAQLGAAIGRDFPYALLEAIAPLKELALREGLGRLVEAELVYQRGLPPRASYTFKHALVQDAAYQSLLESQRRELHGRIADALEQHFPERVAREPEVIARHCEAAGRTAQAIGHYQRAGERASQLSAHEEAIGQLRRALELLGTLPVVRASGRDEPGPSPPRPGATRRGPRAPPAPLRLVHPGLRHAGSEGGQGAAGRAGVGRLSRGGPPAPRHLRRRGVARPRGREPPGPEPRPPRRARRAQRLRHPGRLLRGRGRLEARRPAHPPDAPRPRALMRARARRGGGAPRSRGSRLRRARLKDQAHSAPDLGQPASREMPRDRPEVRAIHRGDLLEDHRRPPSSGSGATCRWQTQPDDVPLPDHHSVPGAPARRRNARAVLRCSRASAGSAKRASTLREISASVRASATRARTCETKRLRVMPRRRAARSTWRMTASGTEMANLRVGTGSSFRRKYSDSGIPSQASSRNDRPPIARRSPVGCCDSRVWRRSRQSVKKSTSSCSCARASRMPSSARGARNSPSKSR